MKNKIIDERERTKQLPTNEQLGAYNEFIITSQECV